MNMPGYIKLKSVVEKDGAMYGEPAEEYAPVAHAYWENYAYEDGFVCAVCSACKWSSGAMWRGYAIIHFAFCPHCAAKMDESEENEE